MSEESFQRARRHPSPIAWAIFLGTSWTWCIGMFLPVLLVRNYGVWGWWVFAIPNVVGAAAMGWVLRRQESSIELVERHARMCVVFSIVTILFHMYFVGWIVAPLIEPLPASGTFLLALLIWMFGLRRTRRDVIVGVVVYLISLLGFAGFWAVHGTPGVLLQVPAYGAFSPRGVVWIAPVCVFGFLLCPYLDLTFHRARRSTSADGTKIAFGVGFGLFFLVMILFTLWYAPWYLHERNIQTNRTVALAIRWIVGTHMAVQSAFTIAIHARELDPGPNRMTLPRMGRAVIALIWAILMAGGVFWLTSPGTGERLGEIGYLLFLAWYGLVFPGYVWLCMFRARSNQSGTRRRITRALITGIVVAAPMYWIGFMNGWTIWLLPGVALVLLLRWSIRKGPPPLSIGTNPEI